MPLVPHGLLPQSTRRASQLDLEILRSVRPEDFAKKAMQNVAALPLLATPMWSIAEADQTPAWKKAVCAASQSQEERPSGKKEGDLHNVFRKLRNDNELHRDDLPKALELARFPKPKPAWIEQAYEKFSRYSTLSQEEFVSFVRDYEELQRQWCAEEFRRLDTDNSGSVEAGELGEFLTKLGLDPMRHVLEEAVREADDSKNGQLEFDEFELVFELVQLYQGFTKRDYELFMSVFSKFDSNGSGRISSSKFASVLAWLGFSWSAESAAEIVREVDIDRSGSLNEQDFVSCMRKVRERELQKIRDALSRTMDRRGRIPAEEIEEVFKLLGYVVEIEAIEEAAQDSDVLLEGEIDLGDLWEILTIYRSREGFSSNDEDEIREAFARCDTQGLGYVTGTGVGKILRIIGSPTTFEVRQDLISKIDIAGTGQLSYIDVRKLVRMCRDRAKIERQKAFQTKDEEGVGFIPKDTACALFDSLGLVDAGDHVVRDVLLGLVHKDVMEYNDYAFVTSCLAKASRNACRDNGGFTNRELRELKVQFRRCDVENTGEIQNGELIRAIDRLFPVFARDKVGRPELERMLVDADENGNGSLDFEDFLRLINKFKETQDQFRFEKEQFALQATGFTKEEVKQFRELFLACDDGDGELSLTEAKEMIQTVVPLGTKNLENFREIFLSISSLHHGVDGHNDQADFPEFLLLMRKMMDLNFGRINERSCVLACKA